MEAHLGTDPTQGLRQKMCRAHPRLDRSERMLVLWRASSFQPPPIRSRTAAQLTLCRNSSSSGSSGIARLRESAEPVGGRLAPGQFVPSGQIATFCDSMVASRYGETTMCAGLRRRRSHVRVVSGPPMISNGYVPLGIPELCPSKHIASTALFMRGVGPMPDLEVATTLWALPRTKTA
jgi:hypothetical protein